MPDFLGGVKLRPLDPRDYDLRSLPGVAEALEAGLPESADIARDFPGPVLNQGSVPSCVAHAMSHQQAIFQWQEERLARVFHASRAHQETGPVDQGRMPDDFLKYCKDRGLPLTGSEQRFRIVAYAFAPKTSPREWEDAIKAAIVAGHPVPIAYLIPSNYGAESSGGPTSLYHETLIVAYRPGGFRMLNSWGQGWGNNGFGWVSIPFLTEGNWQQGYVLAHSSVTDEILIQPPDPPDPPIPPDPPVPPPVVRAFVKGEALGGGLEMLRVGMTLQAAGDGFSGRIEVSEVQRKSEPGPLPPDPIPPNPPIPVGELTIEPTRLDNRWFEFRAKAGAEYVSAFVTVAGSKRMTIARGTGATGARFWLGSLAGQQIKATAQEVSGSRVGALVFTA